MKEKELTKQIQIDATKFGARLFRNNTGQAYMGRAVHNPDGTVLLKPFRGIVKFGLCVGSSDLIGWTPVKITPDMVGQTMAVFTACEVKTGQQVPTKEQKNFLNRVNKAGGIGIVERETTNLRGLLAADTVATFFEGFHPDIK